MSKPKPEEHLQRFLKQNKDLPRHAGVVRLEFVVRKVPEKTVSEGRMIGALGVPMGLARKIGGHDQIHVSLVIDDRAKLDDVRKAWKLVRLWQHRIAKYEATWIRDWRFRLYAQLEHMHKLGWLVDKMHKPGFPSPDGKLTRPLSYAEIADYFNYQIAERLEAIVRLDGREKQRKDDVALLELEHERAEHMHEALSLLHAFGIPRTQNVKKRSGGHWVNLGLRNLRAGNKAFPIPPITRRMVRTAIDSLKRKQKNAEKTVPINK